MLACIGEGNSNPLQYSSLGNPRDRGAWWAAVYGVVVSAGYSLVEMHRFLIAVASLVAAHGL